MPDEIGPAIGSGVILGLRVHATGVTQSGQR
jgi:hypothetical protein